MRRAGTLLILLVLAVLHAPTQAQAVVFAFFPDFLSRGTSEPATLVITGIALLSLARIGAPRS